MVQKGYIVTNYDIVFAEGMYLLIVCLLMTSIVAIHFFYGTVIILKNCHYLEQSIISSGLSFEKQI